MDNPSWMLLSGRMSFQGDHHHQGEVRAPCLVLPAAWHCPAAMGCWLGTPQFRMRPQGAGDSHGTAFGRGNEGAGDAIPPKQLRRPRGGTWDVKHKDDKWGSTGVGAQRDEAGPRGQGERGSGAASQVSAGAGELIRL